MNCNDASSTNADRILVKQAILARDPAWRLPKPQTWRAINDIAIDWMVIFISAWATFRIGWVISPLALVVVGNRQRALGNLLHEAGHGNLSTRREVNDCLAHLFLALPLLSSLSVYREQHARHHAWLGHPQRDPDLLPRRARIGDRWYHAYLHYLTTFSIYRGSLIGHLDGRNLTHRQQLAIFTWWMTVGSAMAAVDLHFALVFCALWLG
ncbi:fatty acid desaturase family protein [Paraburkholderia xenovorans LB400]|uniref:fatty acid desaturase n=1 Tax=Paraburkholderia xenovorans TaxID=36873 RepID=UPI0003233BAF|nr:fatty acid desaturase [Paraburkholderia xenovorans]AIP33748.1 fatty acid desaturase family protein [Paraburkholderia xenovorans LB400]